MMKKFAYLACAAIILLGGGCAQKKSQAETTLTLALRAGTYTDVIKSCLPDFEKKHNVTCNVLALGEDELRTAISNDSANENGLYDLCMVDGSWKAEFTARNVLTNLTELDYSLDDDIIPATTTICYNNGSVYLAPYYGNVTVVLYNKLILKDAGYTADKVVSIDDILAICQDANRRHNIGFLYRGDTLNNLVVDFLPILRSFGGWVTDYNNNPTINTPEFYRAVNTYMTLIETGRAAKKDDLITAIANRSAAIAVGWPGWYTPERNSTMDYFALTGKASHGSPSYNANVYGIWTVGIPRNSTHKETAIQLLSYLMDAKLQKETVYKGGVPCRYSSLQDPAILRKFPQYEVVCKALENGIYRPEMEEWADFYAILGLELKAIFNKEISISEGLINAQRQLDAMLNQHRRKKLTKKSSN
ncbi:MAG: extracellular solute-binding protein [Treponema sp.]|nr:extracellular solute-binding protein [Treponema sp.]